MKWYKEKQSCPWCRFTCVNKKPALTSVQIFIIQQLRDIQQQRDNDQQRDNEQQRAQDDNDIVNLPSIFALDTQQ